jgi:hypothetical protein
LVLPLGRHDLDFVNEGLEFRTRRTVQVSSRDVTSIGIKLPDGSLSVNALPWAEVFVDGRSVGLTPLANLPVPIGSHQITWRHPQLGDASRTVAVTAVTPTRVGIQLR